MLRKRFCTIVKSAKCFHVSRGPSHYWAVLKNRYFRPWYSGKLMYSMHSLLLRRHKFNVVRKQRTQCTTDTHRTHHSCCNCPRLLSPSAPTSHSAAHSNPPPFPLAQTLASGPRPHKRRCDSTRTDYLQRERETNNDPLHPVCAGATYDYRTRIKM